MTLKVKYLFNVLEEGLEPSNLAVLVPKTSAYTNSATPAIYFSVQLWSHIKFY